MIDRYILLSYNYFKGEVCQKEHLEALRGGKIKIDYFMKQTQKIPVKEIDTAKRRLKDILEMSHDDEQK